MKEAVNTVPKEWHVPLAEMLQQHLAREPESFHVPGHKYGQAMALLHKYEPDIAERFGKLLEFDITELSGTDDLHAPSGAIAKAQQLAAACFGAEHTYFLVGGSTAGNLAMVLACCEPGELIIVQRHAHKSILNALALAAANVVFLMPESDPSTGLEIPPTLAAVEQALRTYPTAKAVLLTNPSYYGISADLKPYAELVHSYHTLLLVDEAHGAHYGLYEELPTSALKAGADAVVQSTHKTLYAMTMGAMLHVQGDRINRHKLQDVLAMIQSSSPSYPIMASLDIARAMVEVRGAEMFRDGIAAARSFCSWIRESSAYYAIVESNDPQYRMDPLRVVLTTVNGFCTGYELQRRLEGYGCWAEMADERHVVLLFAAPAVQGAAEKLQRALLAIAKACSASELGLITKPIHAMQSASVELPRISEPVLFTRARMRAEDTEWVKLSDAAGRVAAEAIIPYPPGIPVLYPGEKIAPDLLLSISAMAKAGARFQGASDPGMQTIKVRRELAT